MRKMRRLEHEKCPNCGAKKLEWQTEGSQIYDHTFYQYEYANHDEYHWVRDLPKRCVWEHATYKCKCCGSEFNVKREIHFTKRTIPIPIGEPEEPKEPIEKFTEIKSIPPCHPIRRLLTSNDSFIINEIPYESERFYLIAHVLKDKER